MNIAEEIKSRVPASVMFPYYGFRVNGAGFCKSPFSANDNTPSLKVYEGNRGWHDFSTNCGGDVISFVSQYFGLDFQNAMRKINDDFSLGLPIDGNTDKEAQRKARQEAYKRRKELERRKKVYMALQDARDSALTEFAKLDKAVQNVPSEANLCGLDGIAGPDLYNIALASLGDQTVYALTHIDQAWYKLCESEARLREYEKFLHGPQGT